MQKIPNILSLLLLVFSQPVLAVEKCDIPGKAMYWVADYCMYISETDDFLNTDVQACFEKNKGYDIKNTCENKREFRRKICEYLTRSGHIEGDIEECMNNKEFVPNTVKNNGV